MMLHDAALSEVLCTTLLINVLHGSAALGSTVLLKGLDNKVLENGCAHNSAWHA
jgi:hypothetical protein